MVKLTHMLWFIEGECVRTSATATTMVEHNNVRLIDCVELNERCPCVGFTYSQWPVYLKHVKRCS